MKTFLKVGDSYGTTSAIFRIATASRGDVYMSVSRTPYRNDERAVVEVNSDKFLQLWRADASALHSNIAQGNPDTWRAHRKFSEAEKGFARGLESPVPLAEIGCGEGIEHNPVYVRRMLMFNKLDHYEENRFGYVSFTNGVTRTIWLLAHGVTVFPVECGIRDASLLQTFAGLPGGEFRTVDQLLPVAVRKQISY